MDYQYDSLNRIKFISQGNPSGDLTDTYSYSSFGEVGLEGVEGNPYRYTGRRLDAETGLYYYRARYYSAELGRFLQTDPIGYGDGMNMYAYVRNDPVNARDPSGLASQRGGKNLRVSPGVKEGLLSELEALKDKTDKASVARKKQINRDLRQIEKFERIRRSRAKKGGTTGRGSGRGGILGLFSVITVEAARYFREKEAEKELQELCSRFECEEVPDEAEGEDRDRFVFFLPSVPLSNPVVPTPEPNPSSAQVNVRIGNLDH